jgi:hypothetical protein
MPIFKNQTNIVELKVIDEETKLVIKFIGKLITFIQKKLDIFGIITLDVTHHILSRGDKQLHPSQNRGDNQLDESKQHCWL